MKSSVWLTAGQKPLVIVFPLTQFWFQDKMTAGRGGRRPPRARTWATSNINGTGRAVRGAGGCSSPTSYLLPLERRVWLKLVEAERPLFEDSPTLHPRVLCSLLRLFPCLYIFLRFLLLLHYMLPRHQFPHQNFPTSCHSSLLALVPLSFSKRSWSLKWKAINSSHTRTKTETKTPPVWTKSYRNHILVSVPNFYA